MMTIAQRSSSHRPPPKPNVVASPFSKEPPSPRDFIFSVASGISSQPLQNSDPLVWGVLTAISNNARERPQGMTILLTADEHCIGRGVEDARFQFESTAVSAKHCRLYRKWVNTGDVEHGSNCNASIYLKDTSTNGTFLNWEWVKKNDPEVKVCHGDIISFPAPPEHELAFAYVFREVMNSTPSTGSGVGKRKAEKCFSVNKRMKDLGIGAPKGPIPLDDLRSLQRSNKELRKQLEDQVVKIDTLHNENHLAVERHENELKEVKKSVSKSYLDQLKESGQLLEFKQKELAELNRISSEQKRAMEGLAERLSASMQSCTEANEIMDSQKASIAKLRVQLDEEREKAASDLKAAVQRVQSEAQDELELVSDPASRREREQQELISKLQDSERERCLLIEMLRSKLEDTRQKLVLSDNRVRNLETQVSEGKLATANGRKRIQELEHEIKIFREEFESEKAAREEACAKISLLELEKTATVQHLEYERLRLKAARERIMLRETQLRAFLAEIQALVGKQQEQLKSMQKTQEDEENYAVNTDLDATNGIIQRTLVRENEAATECDGTVADKASAQRLDLNQAETSSNEANVIECDPRSQEKHTQTQDEAEFRSAGHHLKGKFGSDIDGVGTAPVLEVDTVETEQVLETENIRIDGEQNLDVNKPVTLAGDTMQLEDEADANCQESNDPRVMEEDTEPGVGGSWADDRDKECAAALLDFHVQLSESNPSSSAVVARARKRRRRVRQ